MSPKSVLPPTTADFVALIQKNNLSLAELVENLKRQAQEKGVEANRLSHEMISACNAASREEARAVSEALRRYNGRTEGLTTMAAEAMRAEAAELLSAVETVKGAEKSIWRNRKLMSAFEFVLNFTSDGDVLEKMAAEAARLNSEAEQLEKTYNSTIEFATKERDQAIQNAEATRIAAVKDAEAAKPAIETLETEARDLFSLVEKFAALASPAEPAK